MRLWITGVGLVSPLGADAPASMRRVWAGERALRPVTLFDTAGCRSQLAAQLSDLRVAEVAPAGQQERWSRSDALAVLAGREALVQAGLFPRSGGAHRCWDVPIDLVVAGTTAGMFETEQLLAGMHADPCARIPLDRMLSHPLSATADRMREVLVPFRRAQTVCCACSSGSHALLVAATWLRSGRSQRVLVGGADGLCRLTYAGFSCLGALSPGPCRPFDARRQGLNLGEAGAFLVLETASSAKARGALPLAELRAVAVGAEAHHITHPQPDGDTAARVMKMALAQAGLSASDIDYINAHGTATTLNDKMEAAALRRCFGDELEHIAVSSSKSQLGHTLGAAGAVEAVITTMALQRGLLPPTSGLQQVDEACVMNHVLEPRSVTVNAAMSNSFGFGGSDAVVVLARPDHFVSPPAAPARKVVMTGAGTFGPLGVGKRHQAMAYFQAGPPCPPAPLPFEAKAYLDVGRARRIDRAGRLAAVVMAQALADANAHQPVEPGRAGCIMGAAFGAVDACAEFVHRIHVKGARFAKPAVFPNLLPSSPGAHASIYLGLRGAVFAGADLAASVSSALVMAAELIAAGEADSMLAGGVEVHSAIAEAVLQPLLSAQDGAQRGEGAAAILLEAATTAHARGAEVIAEVRWFMGWRGAAAGPLAGAPAPGPHAQVLLVRDDDKLAAALAATAWKDVPRYTCVARSGAHEAAGGTVAAAALGRLAAGVCGEVLLLGLAADRGYALVLSLGEAQRSGRKGQTKAAP